MSVLTVLASHNASRRRHNSEVSMGITAENPGDTGHDF
jgi:hypothetical protein